VRPSIDLKPFLVDLLIPKSVGGKNTNMRIAVLATFLIISAQLLPAMALDNDEKSALEAVATKVLIQSDYITYGLVEIGYGNSMNMWFIPKSTDQETILKSLGSAVGVYVGACKSYPELSDLSLMIGTKGTVAGEMYCDRDWADEVRKDSDGSYNSNDLGLVALRVLGTFKKTS